MDITLYSSVQLWGMERDRPKSQILALQSDIMRMLADFKSRCIMFDSCKKQSEHNEL